MIIAGSGAFYADASQSLVRLARMIKAPVAVPIWDEGRSKSPFPNSLGLSERRAENRESCRMRT